MAEIPGSNLEELALNQAEIVSLLNDHLWCLWCLMNGAESYTPTPPVSPSNGQVYLIGPSATGAWSGKDEQVALRIAGAWHYLDVPQVGWKIFVKDEELYRRYREETSSTSYDEVGWIIDDPDKVYQTLASADSVIVDWELGSTAYCLLDRATTTFSFVRAYAGQRCVLVLEQDGSGNRDAAFGAEVRAGTDTPVPPTLTTGGGEVDYLGFIYNGTDSKYDHVSLSKGFS